MMYFTHIAFALLLLTLIGFGVDSYAAVALTIFGALLPEIDLPSSFIGRIFFPISRWINRKYGHRTIMHSLYVLLIIASFALIVYSFGYPHLIFIFIGYASHLIIDMLTPTGVMLLYPNPTQFVILGGPIEVGSNKEFILFVILLIVLTFSVFISVSKMSVTFYLKQLLGGGIEVLVERYIELDRNNFVDADVKGYWSTSTVYTEIEGVIVDGYENVLIVLYDGSLYRISDVDSSIISSKVELKTESIQRNEELVIPPRVFVDYDEFLTLITENEFTLVSGNLYLAKQLSAQERFLLEEYQKDRPESLVAIKTIGEHQLTFKRAPLRFFERIKRFVPDTTILSGPITVARKIA